MANDLTRPTRPGRLRRWTVRLLAFVGALLLLLAGFGTWTYTQARESAVGDLEFRNAVHIPPLLEPSVDDDGTKRFRLTLGEGRSEFLPGMTTRTWGVNGAYLGPTLRASRGDRVAVDVVNRLPEESTLHWHGMRLPARMDGGPHQVIEPGGTWSPRWTVDQPAASLWYHPHLHGKTGEHVYRGVSGMFLIDDDESRELALPRAYGADDFPLVVQDRKFTDDGELDLDGGWRGQPFGLLGDQILVNGTHDPYLEVTSTRVRLRVLNGSNARSLNVGFADNRGFHLVGTDSGLLPAPQRLHRVRLSPGERAEIVAEFQPGEEVVLRSFPPGEGGGFPLSRLSGNDDEFDLLKIVAADRLTESPTVPAVLASTPPIVPPPGATVREFTMSGTSRINRGPMNPNRIDEVVPAGATEIWRIRNPGLPHNFHIHEVAFRILDINGAPPPGYARGRKDTVYLPPDSTVRLAVQFGTNTDPKTPYLYHCHLLRHEDAGMMGQFVIVEPGTEHLVDRTPKGSGEGHAHGTV